MSYVNSVEVCRGLSRVCRASVEFYVEVSRPGLCPRAFAGIGRGIPISSRRARRGAPHAAACAGRPRVYQTTQREKKIDSFKLKKF